MQVVAHFDDSSSDRYTVHVSCGIKEKHKLRLKSDNSKFNISVIYRLDYTLPFCTRAGCRLLDVCAEGEAISASGFLWVAEETNVSAPFIEAVSMEALCCTCWIFEVTEGWEVDPDTAVVRRGTSTWG